MPCIAERTPHQKKKHPVAGDFWWVKAQKMQATHFDSYICAAREAKQKGLQFREWDSPHSGDDGAPFMGTKDGPAGFNVQKQVCRLQLKL